METVRYHDPAHNPNINTHRFWVVKCPPSTPIIGSLGSVLAPSTPAIIPPLEFNIEVESLLVFLIELVEVVKFVAGIAVKHILILAPEGVFNIGDSP